MEIKHKLHLPLPPLYLLALATMLHLIVGVIPLSFRYHTYFESDVAFILCTFLNECVCCVNLALNVSPVRPMYVLKMHICKDGGIRLHIFISKGGLASKRSYFHRWIVRTNFRLVIQTLIIFSEFLDCLTKRNLLL